MKTLAVSPNTFLQPGTEAKTKQQSGFIKALVKLYVQVMQNK